MSDVSIRESIRIIMASMGLGMLSPLAKVFYVQSTHAAAGNTAKSGEDPNDPFASIDYAVGQCTASRGDIIVALPGHVETVTAASGLVFDIAGVTLIGVGKGSLRPQVNFTTAVGANCLVSAANCAFVNVLFTGGIDALTGPLDIQAADFKFYDCETRDVTGQATDWIVTTAAADRLHVKGWIHRGAAAAGGDTALSIVGGDGIIVEEFEIYGNFAVGAIENVTTAMTNARIGGGAKQNYIQNGLDVATADGIAAVTVVATSTGFIGPNIHVRLGVDATSNVANITGAFVGAAMQFMLPLNVCNLGGEVAMASNITASTDA